MKFESSKEFSYDIDVAWQALKKAKDLGVEPGSSIEVISENTWKAHAHGLMGKETSCTMYEAEFDEKSKTVIITGRRNTKKEADVIVIKLSKIEDDKVRLHFSMQIGMGKSVLGKTIGKLMGGHMHEIVEKSIFDNFEEMCRQQNIEVKDEKDCKFEG